MVDIDLSEFDDLGIELATTNFIGLADLKGCVIAMRGLRSTEMNGTTGTYTAVFCDVIVVSGTPRDNAEEVKLGDTISDMMVSGAAIVGKLEPRLATGKWLLGRVEGKKNRYKTMSWNLTDEVTQPEMTRAAQLIRAYKEAAAKVTAKKEEEDLFA
jgi:hypothetical protein